MADHMNGTTSSPAAEGCSKRAREDDTLLPEEGKDTCRVMAHPSSSTTTTMAAAAPPEHQPAAVLLHGETTTAISLPQRIVDPTCPRPFASVRVLTPMERFALKNTSTTLPPPALLKSKALELFEAPLTIVDRHSVFKAFFLIRPEAVGADQTSPALHSDFDFIKPISKYLGQDSKIKKAAHVMHACLLDNLGGDGPRTVAFEDGEDGAATSLNFVIDKLLRTNERALPSLRKFFCVFVVRWWGGVLLGPARFRHIESVVTDAVKAAESMLLRGGGAKGLAVAGQSVPPFDRLPSCGHTQTAAVEGNPTPPPPVSRSTVTKVVGLQERRSENAPLVEGKGNHTTQQQQASSCKKKGTPNASPTAATQGSTNRKIEYIVID